MRYYFRHLVIWLLSLAAIIVLIGGNSWHVGFCQIGKHRCASSHGHSCRHDHNSHGHASNSDVSELSENETPLAPEHDHESCVICIWYSLCQGPVQLEIVLPNIIEPCGQVAPRALTTVPLKPLASFQSRAPPMLSKSIGQLQRSWCALRKVFRK